MKLFNYNILLLTLFVASSFSISPNDISDLEKSVKWMTFEEAISASKAAKVEGKIPKKIFIDVYTDWCGWCKKMDKNTFENPKIAAYLNKKFYPVKFNAEQKEEIEFEGYNFKFIDQGRRGYHELAAGLMNGKMSYPTVLFMNEDLELMQHIPGYLDVKKFDMIIRYLGEDIYEEAKWEEYEKQYKAKNL